MCLTAHHLSAKPLEQIPQNRFALLCLVHADEIHPIKQLAHASYYFNLNGLCPYFCMD